MGRTLEWRCAAASCQGSSHVESGTPCQDKVLTERFPNGVLVAALADGAGSAKFSHFGAELAIKRASGMLAEKFDYIFDRCIRGRRIADWLISGIQWELTNLSEIGVEAFDEDRIRLELPSADEEPLIQCEVRDLASTLLIVAVADGRFIAVHLGDGVIGVEVRPRVQNKARFSLDANAKGRGRRMAAGVPGRKGWREDTFGWIADARPVRVLSAPTNGEFANETVFTTSQSAKQATRVIRGRLMSPHYDIVGFILMSDGPEASLLSKRERTLAPACGKLLQAVRTLDEQDMNEQLADALASHIALRTHDDCSLALLSC